MAAYSGGKIYVYVEKDGAFGIDDIYVVDAGKQEHGVVAMTWDPSGKRLLVTLTDHHLSTEADWWMFVPEDLETCSIDLTTHEIEWQGTGVAYFGPQAQWLLWSSEGRIGQKKEDETFDRQSFTGERLPLNDDVRRALVNGRLIVSSPADSPLPLCLAERIAKTNSISCVDVEGHLSPRFEYSASTSSAVDVYPDSTRTLYAVFESPHYDPPTLATSSDYDFHASSEPAKFQAELAELKRAIAENQKQAEILQESEQKNSRLRIYDVAGSLKADGRNILDRVGSPPNLAWSRDGRWIAFYGGGRVLFWDWAHDTIAPAAESPRTRTGSAP